jgi:hypothetical protein
MVDGRIISMSSRGHQRGKQWMSPVIPLGATSEPEDAEEKVFPAA